MELIPDYGPLPPPSEGYELPLLPSDYETSSEDAGERSISCSNSIGTLEFMKKHEAAKAIGRAYHKANPNAAARSGTGMSTSDKFGWAGAAFDLMGLAGGALGLGSSPNSSWILTSISLRNDARIVIVPQQINAKAGGVSKPGRVSQSPGVLLPGDETIYKFYKDNDETKHLTDFRFAVASLNPAIDHCLLVDFNIYQHHEAGDNLEKCSNFLNIVAVHDENGDNRLAQTSKANVIQDPTWPELNIYYFQFTGKDNNWPSFGIAALSTNVWYGSTGNNSLRIVFTPHPLGY